MPTDTTSPSSSILDRLSDRLARESRAEVHFDAGTRGLYATDASLYQIEPLGVVVPRTARDVVTTVEIAAQEHVPIVPRGAATSLSGQTIGPAIIIDFSKYLNRIGIVDRDAMTVRVEPGVVLDQLNAHLKPLGLMFGPDVSTSDRATIGGMIGNNSAGARSLRYGKTVDHVRALEVVLADGTTATMGPVPEESLESICSRDDSIGALHRLVRDTAERHAQAIRDRFPRILRRVSGYNLDEFIPGLPVRPLGFDDEPWRFNLSKLIVGSEGTLAVTTAALLKLVPLPAAQGLVVLSFATIPAALDRLNEIVETGPVAVEMLDRMILDLAAENPLYAGYLNFTEGRPAAVLAAQFYAGSQAELLERTGDLVRRFEGRPGVLGVRTRLADAAKDDFWKVRKAGFSLLMGMVGDAKPIAFVEDTAVDPRVLPQFYERFRRIVEKHGVPAACYGHADVGCLHIRPIINVKTLAGVETLRAIAREVSDLVVEYGGAMSGEHGDGLARSLWNRKLFGPEVYSAFQAIKRGFDPENLFNPGKVVGDSDPGESLRIGPDYHPHEPASTLFDFSGQGGFAARGGNVLGRGRLPQELGRHDVPQLHGHARRDAHHARPGQPASACDDRRAPCSGRRLRQRGSSRGARPLPPMQGLQDGMPVQGRHGKAQGRSAFSAVPEPAAPARAFAAGPHLSLESDRIRHGAARERHAQEPGVQMAARASSGHRSQAHAAHIRSPAFSSLVPPASAGCRRRPARRSRAAG